MALKSLPLTDKLIIPLKQHLGPDGRPAWSTFDRRQWPNLLAHTPTSGAIAVIMPHRTVQHIGLSWRGERYFVI
ncbi:hypothetical protein [Sodalis sp.]|uniref:hypothetical protein n=1 Tax=Sodalis sp. (in: enterobacteria) TaxID=1898979 RepID=UPI003873C32D